MLACARTPERKLRDHRNGMAANFQKRKIVMTRYRTLVSSVILASGLGLVAAPSLAAHRDCGPDRTRGEFMEHGTKHMEQHHMKLLAALKLTPDQEGAWKKLLDSEQPMARKEPANPAEWAKLSTPDRAEMMLERMKQHQAQQVEHVTALKEFYAVLTPEQKKTFDDFHAVRPNGMRGKSRHHASHPAKTPPKQ
jgi:Spy/CpxP family protein refolding chaperone